MFVREEETLWTSLPTMDLKKQGEVSLQSA